MTPQAGSGEVEARHRRGRARRPSAIPAAVKLVAVSKTFEAAGHPARPRGRPALFGENRVQEAKAKWPALRERYPGIELHLIGPLQSNKAREAVALFDAIHTIDRPKIAAAIAEEMAQAGQAARSSSSRSTPARSRRRPACCRRRRRLRAPLPRRAQARRSPA